ncbi:MAG: LytR/AlgR family response regulator transcription factor [Eubacterium sp.]
MRLSVAICDDEKIIRSEIKRILLEIRPEYDVSIYGSGRELIKSKKVYDLIFLDIEMPELDGMKTAEILRKNENDEYIIFLTSHVELMPEAFKVKAFRFLNKPIESEKFCEAVTEAEKEILSNEKLAVSIKGEMKLIGLKDIVYLEAFGDGTYIYTNKEVIESGNTLKYWSQRLGTKYFFQTHKSYIVALRHVENIDATRVKMKFNCKEEEVPVSRRKRTQLKQAVFEFVRGNSKFV